MFFGRLFPLSPLVGLPKPAQPWGCGGFRWSPPRLGFAWPGLHRLPAQSGAQPLVPFAFFLKPAMPKLNVTLVLKNVPAYA